MGRSRLSRRILGDERWRRLSGLSGRRLCQRDYLLFERWRTEVLPHGTESPRQLEAADQRLTLHCRTNLGSRQQRSLGRSRLSCGVKSSALKGGCRRPRHVESEFQQGRSKACGKSVDQPSNARVTKQLHGVPQEGVRTAGGEVVHSSVSLNCANCKKSNPSSD